MSLNGVLHYFLEVFLMLLFLEIVAIVFMVTVIFVSVWGFILMNQIFGQMRYKNYLLEKLTQNIYMMATKNDCDNKDIKK
jgi:hypothetical protein